MLLLARLCGRWVVICIFPSFEEVVPVLRWQHTPCFVFVGADRILKGELVCETFVCKPSSFLEGFGDATAVLAIGLLFVSVRGAYRGRRGFFFFRHPPADGAR